MTVGKRLEAWRKESGFTQRDAAKLAGISQAEWHAVETDRVKRIGLDVARAIAAVCPKVTLDDMGQRRPKRRSSSLPPPRRTGTDG